MHFRFVFGSWKINKNVYKIILFDLDINTINVKAISKKELNTYKLINRLGNVVAVDF